MILTEIDFVNTIDFDYYIYEQNAVMVGATGEGKTELMKSILGFLLNREPNINWWIWDFSDRFGQWGNLVHEIDDLQPGRFVIQPNDKSLDSFKRFCNKLHNGAQDGVYSNTMIVVDEIHQYLTKQSNLQELMNIVLSDRNKGVTGFYIATMPQSIPNWILNNVKHVFSMRQEVSSNIEWLRNYLGQEAWLLLSQDKRGKMPKDIPFEIQQYPQLPTHSYIYRNLNKPRPQVVINQSEEKNDTIETQN